MSLMSAIMNTTRNLAAMFPSYYAQVKHDHYKDFGYPERIDFKQLHNMYRRNGLAKAGVEKTVLKTWEDNPELLLSAEGEENILESEIRQRFDDLRFWQMISEADRRSLVGGYSGLILRLGDGKRFDQPVDFVSGGLDGLVELIPAWAGQLEPSSWDTDETSATYGQATMYNFQEAALGLGKTNVNARSFTVHPDRVMIWSKDGTVHCESILEAGYNDLVDMEKIKGAGGEGFWKNAKSAPVLQLDPGAKLKDMAAAMGVKEDEVFEAMNEQVADWQKGFDQLLMLQGMKADTLAITLPSPEHFFNIALQSYAASIDCPLKILVGNQTGERASTEDARDWSKTNMSRRNNSVVPNIMSLINRLEAFNVLPSQDWVIKWADLTESSMPEKIDRAYKMADINMKMGLEPAFLPEEIRAVLDMDPIKGSSGDL